MPLHDREAPGLVLARAILEDPELADDAIADLGAEVSVQWLSTILAVLTRRRFGTSSQIDYEALARYAQQVRNGTDEEVPVPILVDAVLRAGFGDDRFLGSGDEGAVMHAAGLTTRYLYQDLQKSEGITLDWVFDETMKLINRAREGDHGD